MLTRNKNRLHTADDSTFYGHINSVQFFFVNSLVMTSAGIYFSNFPSNLVADSRLFFLDLAMISANHGWLVGFSKPTVFTGASAMFLLVYLALWKYHDVTINSLNGAIMPGDETSAGPVVHSPEDLMEQVIFCDPDEKVHQPPTWFIFQDNKKFNSR